MQNNNIASQLKSLNDKIDELKSDSSSHKKELIVAAVTFVFTLITALTVGYFSNKWEKESQIEIEKIQKQKQFYSQLAGKKFTRMQLYVSFLDFLAKYHYHLAKWELDGFPKESKHLDEAQRYLAKSDDFVIEITKHNESLYEVIGFIRVYFPDSQELDRLLDRIEQLDTFSIPETNVKKGSLEELKKWKSETTIEIKEKVVAEYGKPIDELLEYLSKQIPKTYQ